MEARVQALRFAGGSFDALRGELCVGPRQARLRPRSAAVLALLLEERGRIVGRDELMQRVWPDVVVTDDSLAQCIKEIRRAFGPAADCIRTMPRVGYAFADAAPQEATVDAAAIASAEPAAAAGPASAAAAETAAAPQAASRRRAGVIALALALLTLAVLGWSILAGGRDLAPSYSVLVLPLATSGAAAARDDFADALTDDLTTDLSLIPGTFVIARSTAERYRGQAIDARAVGRDLNVRYLVEGRVQRAGAQVALVLRLVDAQGGGIVWSERFEGTQGDLGTLQRRVSTRVARMLQIALMESESARTMQHGSPDPEQTLELFRAQVRDNPGYAPAWMWAAIAHLQLGDPVAAATHAQEAIRLSPLDARLPYYYSLLGRARLHGGDAAGALAAAEQATRLPGANRYAPLLVAAAAMELGDTSRAHEVMAQFLGRNPGYSAAALRAGRMPVGPRNGEREERYVAALVAAGLPER